jgi:uncharacterized protein
VLCPVVNPPAFEAAQRGNPLDTFSYDMNRIYPGRANGYLTERIAAAHAAAMGPVADIEISIHSGGAHSFLDKSIFVDERPESVELATAMGPGWGCIMSSFNPSGSPMAYLKSLGKRRHHRRTRRPLRHLARALRPRRPRPRRRDPQRPAPLRDVPGRGAVPQPALQAATRGAPRPCLRPLHPRRGVEFLTMMKAGEPIARIVDLFGDTLAELEAPGGRHDLRPARAAQRADRRLVLLLLQGRGARD